MNILFRLAGLIKKKSCRKSELVQVGQNEDVWPMVAKYFINQGYEEYAKYAIGRVKDRLEASELRSVLAKQLLKSGEYECISAELGQCLTEDDWRNRLSEIISKADLYGAIEFGKYHRPLSQDEWERLAEQVIKVGDLACNDYYVLAEKRGRALDEREMILLMEGALVRGNFELAQKMFFGFHYDVREVYYEEITTKIFADCIEREEADLMLEFLAQYHPEPEAIQYKDMDDQKTLYRKWRSQLINVHPKLKYLAYYLDRNCKKYSDETWNLLIGHFPLKEMYDREDILAGLNDNVGVEDAVAASLFYFSKPLSDQYIMQAIDRSLNKYKEAHGDDASEIWRVACDVLESIKRVSKSDQIRVCDRIMQLITDGKYDPQRSHWNDVCNTVLSMPQSYLPRAIEVLARYYLPGADQETSDLWRMFNGVAELLLIEVDDDSMLDHGWDSRGDGT